MITLDPEGAPGGAPLRTEDVEADVQVGLAKSAGATVVRAHWALYAILGTLTGAVLVYGVGEQVYDTNFQVLWEATALLAGDHPYRDFYQWGTPLLTAFTTLVQWLAGYRLIGEFATHWAFIVAGMLLGFHLGVRMSRSVAAALVTTVLAIAIVAPTATYQFPKIFFYPVAVLVAWWYLASPTLRRAAVLGFITAAAFLYRHDHGVYIGVSSVIAFALARVAHPAARGLRSSAMEAAVYLAVAAAVVAPWAVAVQANEGIVDYIRTRAEWNREWMPDRFPFLALLDFNPGQIQPLLRSKDAALQWVFQLSLLLPLLVLFSATLDIIERRRLHERVPLDTYRAVLAALLVVIVASRLFREPGYFVVVLPLSAAFGAWLLAAAMRHTHTIGQLGKLVAAVGGLVITAFAAVGLAAETDLLSTRELRRLRPTLRHLVTTPPIDAYQPAVEALALTLEQWMNADRDVKQRIMIRYMHDCTVPKDRIFVTGSTPYHVGYYAERPIAGGHLQWHHGWRSNPRYEAQSLELLQRQSVPFAFSTHDPVLDDLNRYPRIREHMLAHYQEVAGSGGLLLVDTRREPTRTFGAVAFPCFR